MSITANMRDWQTVRRLGRGLSGEVYEARRANVTAALKIYRPSEAFGADQFRREIANARIVHGIIPDGSPAVLDSDGTAERPWFAMTRAQPLRDTYPRTTAIAFLLRLIDLCIRLRDAGYYHCDLKKDNLCLIDGMLSLLDFASLVRIAFANTHGLRLGSDFHHAPETDADLIVDERTEVFAIAVTFIQFAGFSTILRLAVPLLRALLPFPWMRYRIFEEFRKGVVREPLRIRRLVWISAGVWKTKIVTTWTTLVSGAVVLTFVVAFCGVRYADSIRGESEYRRRNPTKLKIRELVGEGYVAYRTGDMVRASNLLEAAISSRNFTARDYPHFDVEALYRDACDRLRRTGAGGNPSSIAADMYQFLDRLLARNVVRVHVHFGEPFDAIGIGRCARRSQQTPRRSGHQHCSIRRRRIPSVVVLERKRHRRRVSANLILGKVHQRERIGSGMGHNHLVGTAVEVARAVFGQLGNRDRELVAPIGFVVADVVVKPGVIPEICDRDIVIGESGSEPVGILDFSDEAGRRLGRKVVS